MELVLKSDNEESVAKIIALAKKLNVMVERKGSEAEHFDREVLKNRIANFKGQEASSFGDAAEWEREQRNERNLPFN